MEENRMKYFILIASAMFLTAGLFYPISTAEGLGHGFHGMLEIFDQLTEEQRMEIHETMSRMGDEGASPCEVHETVREMLIGYEIDLPDHPGFRDGSGRGFGHGPGHCFDQLTEEQRTEIHETMGRMRDEGASPCEVHETVREMLEGYGVEPPEKFGGRHHGWHP
jgi:hypothetical protein